jgi:hypothetical protein
METYVKVMDAKVGAKQEEEMLSNWTMYSMAHPQLLSSTERFGRYSCALQILTSQAPSKRRWRR